MGMCGKRGGVRDGPDVPGVNRRPRSTEPREVSVTGVWMHLKRGRSKRGSRTRRGDTEGREHRPHSISMVGRLLSVACVGGEEGHAGERKWAIGRMYQGRSGYVKWS